MNFGNRHDCDKFFQDPVQPVIEQRFEESIEAHRDSEVLNEAHGRLEIKNEELREARAKLAQIRNPEGLFEVLRSMGIPAAPAARVDAVEYELGGNKKDAPSKNLKSSRSKGHFFV